MRPGIVISDTIPTTSKTTTTTSTTTTTMMSTSTTTTTEKSTILNSKIKALEAELFGVLDASTNGDLNASTVDDMNASTDNEKETAATHLNTELEDTEVIQVQVKGFTVFFRNLLKRSFNV